ncbi:MAG: DUF4097 family beta strand repeat-containing protein [Candidatus Acidiferrales bacterium]
MRITPFVAGLQRLRPMPGRRSLPGCLIFVAAVIACFAWPTAAFANPAPQSSARNRQSSRLTSDLRGTAQTHDGQHLRLVTDLGNIVIHTQDSGKVDYDVHLETDASQKDAKRLLSKFSMISRVTPDGVVLRGSTSSRQLTGRLWVTITVNVPKNYSLDVSTGGGNINIDDVRGRVSLSTSGGNITAGNIRGAAHLETDGGHIAVKNVAGELVAATGGGHITAGDIAGNAALHTSGGHIRVASVGGSARLETAGGNVTLEHSGGDLVAETLGGQIDVGEASGIVQAKTGGGGIRVVHLSGPTNLKTDNGSIYLTQVDSSVKASTDAGGITAWFATPVKLRSTCELQSGDGDIVVYLPRQLPVTIDAQIQLGDQHRVIVDPAFPLKVIYDDGSNGARVVRAEGALNGGGEILRLRAVSGNIRLIASDLNKQMQLYKQQMDQLQHQLEFQLRELEESQTTGNQPQ